MASTVTVSTRISTTDEGRHRLRMWVSETTDNIPGKLFVYQELPTVPFYTLTAQFVHVASYADITEYPDDEAGELSSFFRLHWLDLVFDSMSVLKDKERLILGHLRHTVEDIVRLNGLVPTEVQEVTL